MSHSDWMILRRETPRSFVGRINDQLLHGLTIFFIQIGPLSFHQYRKFLFLKIDFFSLPLLSVTIISKYNEKKKVTRETQEKKGSINVLSLLQRWVL